MYGMNMIANRYNGLLKISVKSIINNAKERLLFTTAVF